MTSTPQRRPLKRVYASASGTTHLVKAPRKAFNQRTASAGDQRLWEIARANGHKVRPEMLYVSTRAISARVNQNFDGFPSEELKKAAHTFIRKPVFINHNNDEARVTRGIIAASEYREAGNDKYIQLLIGVNAQRWPRMAARIAKGELDSVSMGCDVEFTKCSFCNRVAHEVEDFCDHVRYDKGRKLSRVARDGSEEKVLVYEKCAGLGFFEISFVFDPADETAIAQHVYMPKRSSLSAVARKTRSPWFVRKATRPETVSPEDVSTLEDTQKCPQCGADSYDGKSCDLCDFVKPPEQLDDPDVAKSLVLQKARKDNQQTEDAGAATPFYVRQTPQGKGGGAL